MTNLYRFNHKNPILQFSVVYNIYMDMVLVHIWYSFKFKLVIAILSTE